MQNILQLASFHLKLNYFEWLQFVSCDIVIEFRKSKIAYDTGSGLAHENSCLVISK